MRLRNAFKYSVWEASKLVSTKTLLLKHYYRRQGMPHFWPPKQVYVPHFLGENAKKGPTLVAPYRAILRYYRCDTPYRAILFKRGQHTPTMVRYPPPLVLNFTQTHLCDTPFCNVSRDNCAIPHKNKHERV